MTIETEMRRWEIQAIHFKLEIGLVPKYDMSEYTSTGESLYTYMNTSAA